MTVIGQNGQLCLPLSEMDDDEWEQIDEFLATLSFRQAGRRVGRDRETVASTVRRWAPRLRQILQDARNGEV